jgi:hypothetical protein
LGAGRRSPCCRAAIVPAHEKNKQAVTGKTRQRTFTRDARHDRCL